MQSVYDLPGGRVPGIVNGICYALDPIGYPLWFGRRFGPLTRSRFPGLGLIVNVGDPELVHQVFTGDPATFHAGEANAPVLEPSVGRSSVLTLDDAEHLRQRKLLLAPFHGENLRRWREEIQALTEDEIERWPLGEPFALHERMRRVTLEVILRVVFGVRELERSERAQVLVARFADRATPISMFQFARRDLGPLSPWARFKRARSDLDAFLHEEVERRRASPDRTERSDVLSLLLDATDEAGQRMTRTELRDELVTVLGAGHETSATALSWCFERLLRHPAVLERLTNSLDDGDEYLDATIKEVLRIRPVVSDVARRLTREVELGGYRLPAGTLVMPSITGIHFRPDLYPDPDEFRPERFLGEPPGAYTWIPFGGGVRRCIGATFAQFEMRVILRTVLSHVRLRAADPRPERARLRHVTAAPRRGCRVVVEAPPAAGRRPPRRNARLTRLTPRARQPEAAWRLKSCRDSNASIR